MTSKPLAARIFSNGVSDRAFTADLLTRERYSDVWFRFEWECFGDGCGDGKTFNLSKARNQAIDHAMREGFEWLLILDADDVLISGGTKFPANGFAHPSKFLSTKHETEFQRFDLSDMIRWNWGSAVLLRRDLFSKHRFCEDYVGYGYEECDFFSVVLRDAAPDPSDISYIHLFHPRTDYHQISESTKTTAQRRLAWVNTS